MPEPPKIIAVGLGEILWDLLPAGKQLGGAPANFAYHAQVLGAQSFVVSAVGRDDLGEEILQRVRGLGLDSSHLGVDPAHPTGAVSVQVDAAGVPTYGIHQNVAWDFIPSAAATDELARQTNVVCFGSLAQRSPGSRATIRRFLSQMSASSLRIFDINLRQKFYDEATIRQSLELSNVLKLNDQELPIVAELLHLPADPDRAIDALLKQFNLRLVALTLGSQGSSLHTPEQTSRHAGYKPATLADTVGAGDAFTAAVAIGMLAGRSVDEINDVANRLASYVCSQPGATPPVPAELGFDHVP